MIGHFWASGLIAFWRNLEKYLKTLVIKTGYYGFLSEKQLELIVLTNLTSLFIFWGGLLGFYLFVLFLGVEMREIIFEFVKRQYKCCVLKSKIKYQQMKKAFNLCRKKRNSTIVVKFIND